MITHQDYVAAVCDTLDAAGGEPVVLIGHSLGGTVIGQVADRRPDHVGRLVYYAAFVPGDGEALGDVMPAEMRLARRVYDRLVPEPYRPVFAPIHLSRPTAELTVPRTFLSARQDRTMPPGFWHPHMSSRLGHARTIEIDGDHQVLLSAPDRLADALLATVATGEPAQPAGRRRRPTEDPSAHPLRTLRAATKHRRPPIRRDHSIRRAGP